jgi:hypothetical protein
MQAEKSSKSLEKKVKKCSKIDQNTLQVQTNEKTRPAVKKVFENLWAQNPPTMAQNI